jgi:DNA-directed RNA polymerase specialized sigma subunit
MDNQRLSDLVAEHARFVHSVAVWAARRTPHDVDDLEAWGYEALLRLAAEDASTPLIRSRLRYRMLDLCRTFDRSRCWAGGRPHTVARRLVPLDDLTAASLADRDDPADIAANRDLARRALALIDQLPERDRDMMRRVAAGEPLAAIGRSHGVTESRVCQIRRRFAANARTRLAA